MFKNFLKIYLSLLAFGAIFIFITGLVLTAYFKMLGAQVIEVKDTLVKIPHGSSMLKVSLILEQEKIIDNASKFYWYLRLGRKDGFMLQAGHYQFSGSMTLAQTANRLRYGHDLSYMLIFKEGQTLVDLSDSLEKLGLCSKQEFELAMTDDELTRLVTWADVNKRKTLQNDMGGLEGYLFPDTYFFTKKDSAKSIIIKMHQRLLDLLNENIKKTIKDRNLSLHEVLTMAAIVEKETGASFERPIIASVYQNRLLLAMRLQADPTVIYGIKDYDGKIRKKDLLTYHSYNTYKIPGLPPGPIASPGIEAIKSVLWPAQTKYLYFVSKNDGTHVFCENLACHNEAVRKWQIDYFKNASLTN